MGGPDTETTVNLQVSGMHCASCVALIEDVLLEEPGIHLVQVDLDQGRASVTLDAQIISVDAVCRLVTEAGYATTAMPASTVTGGGSSTHGPTGHSSAC